MPFVLSDRSILAQGETTMMLAFNSFRFACARHALAALPILALAAFAGSPALAGPPILQFADFYHPDGTPVVSDGGMPFVHAALFRFADQPRRRIIWQLMTQGLTPRARYDIWIAGSEDGSAESGFRWWVGSAKATPRGDLDAIGLVYTGEPPGKSVGQFTHPDAPLYLVITTDGGDAVQAAFFPAP
jgi:hypothetical protein